MRYKTAFVAGVGVGYVLGAKAGRARYEQIVAAARSLAGRPEVARLTEVARREATDLVGTARRAVTDTFGGQDVTPSRTPEPVGARS